MACPQRVSRLHYNITQIAIGLWNVKKLVLLCVGHNGDGSLDLGMVGVLSRFRNADFVHRVMSAHFEHVSEFRSN